jgi:large subunit ribosomal protein L4
MRPAGLVRASGQQLSCCWRASASVSAPREPAARAISCSAVASSSGGPFARVAPPPGVRHFERDLSFLRSVPVLKFETNEEQPSEASAAAQVAEVDLDPRVFGEPLRPDLLHKVVVWQRNRWRQGGASGKTRAEVRGSTRKLRPQKGQGRARVGSARPPHFRKGGVAFAPKPRDFSIDLPKKVRRKALRVALSAHASQGSLVVVDDLALEQPRTSHVADFLGANNLDQGGVVFVPGPDVNTEFRLSAHNIPLVDVLPSSGVQVYALVHRNHAVISLAGLNGLYQRLLEEGDDGELD